jgi:streptogramin lyase
VLNWGDDECVLWNLAVPSTGYQTGVRPTAWEGSTESNGCANPNPRLWIGWYDQPANSGVFHRIEGSTGQVLDTVNEPWNSLNFGPYGGAVNQAGDFWVIGWQLGPLVRIDGETLEVERIEMPAPPADQQWSYGMSLDQYGNPWIASAGAAATYNVQEQQWKFVSTGNASMRGVMVDAEDRAWFAVDARDTLTGGCALAVVDVNTLQVLSPATALPGCVTPVGVSIDVEGYVWVVDQGANQAMKIDPDTYQLQLSVPNLVNPYTYSDMTGAGLNLVVNPPVG